MRMIAELPGPGEWKISVCNGFLVLASPHSGIYTLRDDVLRKVPPDWDGVSLGRAVHLGAHNHGNAATESAG